jgi:hypothetical protein
LFPAADPYKTVLLCPLENHCLSVNNASWLPQEIKLSLYRVTDGGDGGDEEALFFTLFPCLNDNPILGIGIIQPAEQ